MIRDLLLHVSDVLSRLLQHLSPTCLVSPQCWYTVLETLETVLDGVSSFPLHGVVKCPLIVVLAPQPRVTAQIIIILEIKYLLSIQKSNILF